MRRKSEQKWRVGLKSSNKKSLDNKLAKSYDSSKSQTSKTAPQPTRHFCSPFVPIGYNILINRLNYNLQFREHEMDTRKMPLMVHYASNELAHKISSRGVKFDIEYLPQR